MIDFIKPNKPKFKLSLIILSTVFLLAVFQSITSGYLKQLSSKEYDQIMAKEKHSELRKSFEGVAATKVVEGNELSSLHLKFFVIRTTISLCFTVVLSYLGGCLIYTKRKMLIS